MDDIVSSDVPHSNLSDDIPLKCCKKCGEEKPATDEFFRRSKAGKGGLHAQCKVCRSSSDRNRRNRPEIKEHCRAYDRDRHSRPEVKEHNRVYQRVYSKRPEQRARKKAYHQSPRERALHTIRRHNRRALELAAEGTYTPRDIQNMLKGQKGKCAECKKKLVKYHVDHIIPLSRGGSNWPHNLQLLCPTCNLRKHDRLPHEFDGSGQMRLFS